jgi:hypothetical protein
LRAFSVGFVAGALIACGIAFLLGVMADARGWESFTLAGGPFELLRFERLPSGTSSSFGYGIPIVALVLGLLNAAGALALVKRRAGREFASEDSPVAGSTRPRA